MQGARHPYYYTWAFHPLLPRTHTYITFLFFSAVEFEAYYSMLSGLLCPLSSFNSIPEHVTKTTHPDGCIGLQTSDGKEAVFNVIGVVVNSCLQAPPGYPR